MDDGSPPLLRKMQDARFLISPWGPVFEKRAKRAFSRPAPTLFTTKGSLSTHSFGEDEEQIDSSKWYRLPLKSVGLSLSSEWE